ncbi:MAG: hypothetical protein RLZZ165_2455 [Bacteroidota bacterium]|jgi:uncharacterized protein YyaL (SSP411 family)
MPIFLNHLAQESSPYLLQHVRNPVDWYPWGPDALEKAKRENKLLIISIGYAACHWCHVMEHECFEDEAVGTAQNAHFVSIKVDREERPDIDQIYMDAVQLMTGQGGWPLNCVALPDGRPIWGGTYFRKGQWLDILAQLAELWCHSPDEADGYAERLTDAVRRMDAILPATQPSPFTDAFLEKVLQPWRSTFDPRWGGYNRAPKFPMPNNWLFLLREGHRLNDGQLLNAVRLTLEKMAWGGIYDHLRGGFSRYSVDGTWKVPHFEKMTYDNGQLLSLYSEAYRFSPNPLYQRIVSQTFEFMECEMQSPEGGWYASLDADSEGVEGKFYVWKKSEVDELLGSDSGWWCDYYQITRDGNWEHGNSVLIAGTSPEAFAAARGISTEAFLERLSHANAILLKARGNRIRPGLDDKLLASWNALMIKGCVDAYRAFRELRYLEAALRGARFISAGMYSEGRLMRKFKAGKTSIPAFLDDYALVADAFVALYQVCFDDAWLRIAERLMEHVQQHFYHPGTQLFYFTSDEDPVLIARKLEVMDNVIPASNSVLANVLWELGHLVSRSDYTDLAERMLQNVQPDMPRYGGGYSNWAILMQHFLRPFLEVVVTGPDAKEWAEEIDRNYFPNKVLVASVSENPDQLALLDNRFETGMNRIYICQNHSCHIPQASVADALALMAQLGGYSLK